MSAQAQGNGAQGSATWRARPRRDTAPIRDVDVDSTLAQEFVRAIVATTLRSVARQVLPWAAAAMVALALSFALIGYLL